MTMKCIEFIACNSSIQSLLHPSLEWNVGSLQLCIVQGLYCIMIVAYSTCKYIYNRLSELHRDLNCLLKCQAFSAIIRRFHKHLDLVQIQALRISWKYKLFFFFFFIIQAIWGIHPLGCQFHCPLLSSCTHVKTWCEYFWHLM